MQNSTMFHWLRKLGPAPRRRPDREALLNDGLALTMDWGEHWLAPIQGRLRRLHTHLGSHALDELDATCRQAMKFGHDAVYAMVLEHGQNVSEDEFAKRFREQYPWASAENTARLFRQGTYYAWKSGGPS
jgi:hypothetical protein